MPTETFFGHPGIPLRVDRVYRLTAIYENPTGEMIPLGAIASGECPVHGRASCRYDPRLSLRNL